MSFAFMPIYTGDYLRDTRHLSPLKHGVYYLALMYCWDAKGPLPLDDQDIAGICNCRSTDELDALRYILERFFIKMEDGWYNSRMQKEIERAHAIGLQRQIAGAKGYQARAKQLHLQASASARASTTTPTTTTTTTTTTTPTTSTTKTKVKTLEDAQAVSDLWQAYSSAYSARYGVIPVRNAKVNSELAGLLKRIGHDEAPKVAAFYLTHARALYLSAKHPTNLLLRDAEGLRTEWATGRRVTETSAKQGDRTAALGEAFAPLIQAAEDKERKGKFED